MKKTLYRYRFNVEDGSINVLQIDDYEVIHGMRYRFRYKNIMQYVYMRNLDKVNNYSYYTFTPDLDIARQKIDEYLSEKIKATEKELDKWKSIRNKLNKGD